MLRDLLEKLGERGALLAPDAAEWLAGPGAPVEAARDALLGSAQLPFLLTRSEIEAWVARSSPAQPTPLPGPAETPVPPPTVARGSPAALATGADARPSPALSSSGPTRRFTFERASPERPSTDRADGEVAPAPRPAPYAHRFEIAMDVTGDSRCEGDIADFTRYFNDRLQKVKKLLRARREMVGCVPIKAIRPGAQAEVKFIGMVSDVRKTKNGHRLIEIEDETGTAAVLAPASDASRIADAETVIEDEVVGVVAKPAKSGDLLILDRFVRPDVPLDRTRAASESDSIVAFVSDLHIGSKTFLADDWARFVRFLTLAESSSERRALAGRVKYLVVNGDVVDGIGIFPGQEDELAIRDGYEQYDEAGRQFTAIQEARPDLKIFVVPGNHDLVRPAEPQPAFPEKYRRLFPKETVFVGNPVKLLLEGVEILSYHGRSFDDWITRVQGLSYERPIEAMRQMMQRRHMVPIYGLRTPIAPEHRDYLVMDTVPDVFATGHVHAAGMEVYRGTMLVNSSCWQSQTSYQKMHGFQPVPGRVPIYDLKRGVGEMLDFHTGASGIDRVGKSRLPTPDPRVPAGAVV